MALRLRYQHWVSVCLGDTRAKVKSTALLSLQTHSLADAEGMADFQALSVIRAHENHQRHAKWPIGSWQGNGTEPRRQTGEKNMNPKTLLPPALWWEGREHLGFSIVRHQETRPCPSLDLLMSGFRQLAPGQNSSHFSLHLFHFTDEETEAQH